MGSKENENTLDSLNDKINKLEKDNHKLHNKLTELEEHIESDTDNKEETKTTDIRIVILSFSIIGLIATALLLMYKG